jgi:hypothetical protein
MTITSTTVKESFAGNDVTVAFSYTFVCYATDQISVVLRNNTTGVQTTKTETTHYSVALDSDYIGGTVTMVTAPATGETLYLISNIDKTQELDLVASGEIAAETLEARLDKMQIMINELQAQINRCIQIPSTESTTVTLPSSVDRASEYCKFDASGNVTTSAT